MKIFRQRMVHRELTIHVGSDIIYIDGGGEVIAIERQTGAISEHPNQVIPTCPTGAGSNLF